MRTVKIAQKNATHSRKTKPAIHGCGRGVGGVLLCPETKGLRVLVILKILTDKLTIQSPTVVHAHGFFMAFCRKLCGLVMNDAAAVKQIWATCITSTNWSAPLKRPGVNSDCNAC